MLLGGIDIGGTKIAVGVADERGRLLAQARVPTQDALGPKGAIVRAVAALHSCLAQVGTGALEAVGVGCCGPLDSRRGLVLSPPNLKGWDEVPLVEWIQKQLQAPAALENDCNAAALGELHFGAGVGARDLLYVTLSTGIGGGVIIDGRLVRGVRDGAGEIGHQTVAPDGPRCGCGNRGCLEALASGTAIARRAREAVSAGGDAAEPLREAAGGTGDAVGAEHVVALARSGDPLAVRLWDETLDWLAIGLGNAISTLAPERVVIGGGVATAGETLLFAPLRRRLAARVKLVPMERVQVIPAACAGDAGLQGAVAVALEKAADARGR